MKSLKIGQKELAFPLIQGGMAVKVSRAPLAAAVAEEGGLGVIGGSGLTAEELEKEIKEARYLTRHGAIGVNLMVALRQFKELAITALTQKVDALIVGAGFSRDIFQMAKEASVPIIPIVSSVKAAILAERMGADGLIVEGGEAGGHLGTEQPLFSILEPIVETIKVPVIAAGGLLSALDIRKVLSLNARGVQLGTRFAASLESSPHQNWKDYYLKARPEDVVKIKSPAGLPGQAILNSLVKKINEGREVKPKIITSCIKCLNHCLKNFCILDALILAQRGDVDDGLIFAGARVGEISNLLLEAVLKWANGWW